MRMNASENKTSVGPAWLTVVRSQVESLRFGVVQVVVHDSRVVQIERTEKLRLGESELKPFVKGAGAAAETSRERLQEEA